MHLSKKLQHVHMTCVLLQFCIVNAAMLPVLIVQLAIPELDAGCTLLARSCNYVHILTVMSLPAECSLLFGWAADPRYIIELCFIFLRPPRTHAKDWFTCWCYWGRNLFWSMMGNVDSACKNEALLLCLTGQLVYISTSSDAGCDV